MTSGSLALIVWLRPGLIAVGILLLLPAWMMSTRPFAAPDEFAHVLRAIAIADGTLTARQPPHVVGRLPPTLAWEAQDTRIVRVPVKFLPPRVTCRNGIRDPCYVGTYTGTYPPLSYLLPASASLIAGRDNLSWLTRLGATLGCAIFLLLAVALSWRGGTLWSAVGLLGALTPMVLFVSSVVNPSGLEIASGLALIAALFRLSCTGPDESLWVWIAAAAAGAVTILAWQLGPAFVIADLAVAISLVGRKQLRLLTHTRARRLWGTAAVLGAALVLYIVYGIEVHLFHSSLVLSPFWKSLRGGIDQIDPVLQQAVGVFGSLTVPLPEFMVKLWQLLVIVLTLFALALADTRRRVLLLVVVVASLAIPVLFYAWSYRLSGFGLQGRYFLPVLALVPMLSGELIYRRRERLWVWAHSIPGLVVVGVAVFQLYAWWTNARVMSGGYGLLWIQRSVAWQPALGWWPWFALALGGSLALVAAGALELRDSFKAFRGSRSVLA